MRYALIVEPEDTDILTSAFNRAIKSIEADISDRWQEIASLNRRIPSLPSDRELIERYSWEIRLMELEHGALKNWVTKISNGPS